MRYLTLGEVLEIYGSVLEQSGGTYGVRDLGALQSALAQPRMTFGDQDLYPTVVEKAATLGFSIVQNHPFVDGNKRAGHAAMEVFLLLNGYEIDAGVDEQERIVLGVAKGDLDREALTTWLGAHIAARTSL
jgi:death-on-curing protein